MGEEAVGEGFRSPAGRFDKATHDDEGGHGERRCAESSIAWRVAVEVLPPALGVFHFVSRPL